jgi:acylphosphatase
MKRRRYIFKGRVQGVGFRYKTKLYARMLDLTGNVRNLANGDVELNVQGKEESIDILIQKLREDKMINIINIFKEDQKLIKEDSFTILR